MRHDLQAIRDIITGRSLTYQQQQFKLAMEAENTYTPLRYPAAARRLIRDGVICEMFEGNAPYRPRYTLPDYPRFLRRGSAFLGLPPARTLADALAHLLILYRHVPSITSFPVFLGELDALLEPYVRRVPRAAARAALRRFLLQLDRTLTDSFVHANIGPRDSVTGRLILELERELKNTVPNLTLKWNRRTPPGFLREAVLTALVAAKPAFVNDERYRRHWPQGYGVASCYNTLPLGGGSHTLVRLNLKALAQHSRSTGDFLDRQLPRAVAAMAAVLNERTRFLVEESAFFTASFLVAEHLLRLERFTAMFGVFGMAEAVNVLTGARRRAERYGHAPAADALADDIMRRLTELVRRHPARYCRASGGRFALHAQSGITCDRGVSPGVRIPVGDEPELAAHLARAAKLQRYFPAGVSDIFVLDRTVRQNPQYAVDLVAGALRSGMQGIAIYADDSELVRITGFLVKRSDVQRVGRGQAALHDTAALGLEAFRNKDVLNRAVRAHAR